MRTKYMAGILCQRDAKLLQQLITIDDVNYIRVLPRELIDELLFYFSYRELIILKSSVLCNYITRDWLIMRVSMKTKIPKEAFKDVFKDSNDKHVFEFISRLQRWHCNDIPSMQTSLYNWSINYGYPSIVKYFNENNVKIHHGRCPPKPDSFIMHYNIAASICYLSRDDVSSDVIKSFIQLNIIDPNTLYKHIKRKLRYVLKQLESKNKYLEDVRQLVRAKENLKKFMESENHHVS